jgi:hypothetical protein
MATRPINPTVHIPEEGTYYYRSFWGSYKGHAMGLVRGILTGGSMGTLMGAAIMGTLAIAGVTGIGAPLALAYFAATGAMLGAKIMGSAGHSAGAAAAATAEEELRLRYPGSGDGIANSLTSPQIGDGHHYETHGSKRKLFHWDVGVPMGLLFAGVGALLAVAAGPAGLSLLAAHGITEALFVAASASSTAALVGGVAALGGVFGFSFGVDRAHFKTLFNNTDEWMNGNLMRTRSKSSLLEETNQELTKEAAEGKANPVITTLERQDEFHRLFNDYLEKTFWSSINGNMRGFLGGGVIGGVIGLALGAAVAVLAPPFALPIMLAATSLGAYEGIAVFSRAGIEGGAQAAAKEALEVKRQRLQKGLDPEHEPHKAKANSLFNGRTMLTGIAAGAIGGVVLGPIAGAAMGHALHLQVAAGSLLSSLASGISSLFTATYAGSAIAASGAAATAATTSAAVGAATGTAVGTAISAHAVTSATSAAVTEMVAGTAASGLLGASIGATAGIGQQAYKAIAAVSDSFYLGSIVRGRIGKEAHHRRIPYLAPNSPWVPKEEMLQRAVEKISIPYSSFYHISGRDMARGRNTEAGTPALAANAVGTPLSNATAVAPAANASIGLGSSGSAYGGQAAAPVAAAPAAASFTAPETKDYPSNQPLKERIQHIIAERAPSGHQQSATEMEEKRRSSAPIVQTGQVL